MFSESSKAHTGRKGWHQEGPQQQLQSKAQENVDGSRSLFASSADADWVEGERGKNSLNTQSGNGLNGGSCDGEVTRCYN